MQVDAPWTVRRYRGRIGDSLAQQHSREEPMRLALSLTAALTLSMPCASFAASSAPTPMPGGANQRAGTSGSIDGELFNGKLRLRKMTIVRKTEDGDNYVVFSTLIANGTNKDRVTLLEAHLADADGVTLNQTAGDPKEGPCTLAPGAACRETFRFKVTDDFHPVKVLVEELANGTQPVFRVNVGSI
jgi:hypothetical protein